MRPEQHSARKNKPDTFFVAIAVAFFVLLIVFRVLNILDNTPEYDEIWTVQHYVHLPVSRIFSEVSVPNNHVLNTLGIKLFFKLVPDRTLAFRMTSLLGFCGLCFILLRGVLLFLKDNMARGAVLALVLLDGAVLHYAETARGYSLQTLFVFGLLLSLLRFAEGKPEDRAFNAVMWFLCAAGSCLSVSSGVLFVAILTGLWCLLYVPVRSGVNRIRLDYWQLILAGAAWSAFVLVWYGGNYESFAQGRVIYGDQVESVSGYFAYCGEVLLDTRFAWALPCLAAGTVWLRRTGKASWRICALSGGAIVLMLLSALVTKCGPVRVFYPLIPAVFFGVGIVLDELFRSRETLKKFSPWILALVVAVSAVLSESRRKAVSDPDLVAVFGEIGGLDSRIYVSYRPVDLYVLTNLLENAVNEDNERRQSSPEMLLLLHDDHISVVREGGTLIENVLPGVRPVSGDREVAGENVPYWLYRLRPVRSGEQLAGRAVLCFAVIPLPGDAASWLLEHFAVVNAMLAEDSVRQCLAASGEGLNADELLKWERSCPGQLSFLVVSDEPETADPQAE